MPDDIKVLQAVGDDTVAPPVATDLIASKHYQKVKFGWGADGTWNETDDSIGKRLPTSLPPASTITNAASGTIDVGMLGATVGLRLMGFSCKEDAGVAAPAEFTLRHGTSVAGTPIAHVTLGPDESVRDWFGPNGIAVPDGIFLDRVSGTTDVTTHTMVAS